MRSAKSTKAPWAPLELEPANDTPTARAGLAVGHGATNEAIERLAAPEVNVFQRAGELVHIVRAPIETEEQGLIMPGGAPAIRPLRANRITEILASLGGIDRNDLGRVVQFVMARDEWAHIRPLDAITSYPVLKPDGRVLKRSGYDASTRTLAHIDGPPIEIYKSPKRARDAVSVLLELVEDFPFGGDAHRAAWLASLLTPLARPAIKGPTPLFLLEASMRGSGKTKLTDIVSEIVQGTAIARRAMPKTPEEWDKTILALLRGGQPMCLIDNVTTMIKSDALDAVLTGTEYTQRVLGESNEIRVPVRVVLYATLNNGTMSPDIVRRAIVARLEPQCEHPEARSDFHRPDLIGHVREHRAIYLSAALTILRAYAAAGRPQVKARPIGSFESWARVVRDALVWAGCEDPVQTQEELREHADVERDELGELLRAWHGQHGERELTAGAAFDAARGSLRDAIEGITPHGREASAKALGYYLRKARGAIAGGLRLVHAGEDRKRRAQWRVVRNEGAPQNPRKKS